MPSFHTVQRSFGMLKCSTHEPAVTIRLPAFLSGHVVRMLALQLFSRTAMQLVSVT